MSLAPKYPKLVVAKILETNYTNLFQKPKRDVFGETKYYFLETNDFNLILIFFIGKTIINIICDKIRTNSLQDLHEVPEHLWSARKRHCVPSENNSFLQNQNQSKCNSFLKETKREIIFCFMSQIFP